MTRTDPELGTVRRCRRCLEEWPLDEEFFGPRNTGYLRRTCRACRTEMSLGITPPSREAADVQREAEQIEARRLRLQEMNKACCRRYYASHAERERQRKRDARKVVAA